MKTTRIKQRHTSSCILAVGVGLGGASVQAQSEVPMPNSAPSRGVQIQEQNSPLLTIGNANQTATDDLGRTLPTFAQVGAPKANRHVGMFYWLWHGNDRWLPGNQYDLTEYLKTRPYFNDFTAFPPVGPHHPTFYWAQPIFGYYRSTDPYVMRKHLVMLADAGVDFLFLDYTNGSVYDAELQVFLDVARDLKNAGVKVPKLTFFLNSEPEWKIYALYDKWYRNPEYADMWFRWWGRPLLMSAAPTDATKLRAGQDGALLPVIQSYFTYRPTWAFHDATKQPTKWRFIHGYNAPVANDPQGRPEQLVVNKSTGGPIWDGIKEGGVSAVEGKTYQQQDYAPDWTLKDAGQGAFFQNAWNRALEIAPPMLLVTGWNEWRASVWNTPGVVMLGRKNGAGQGHIVDEFNMQFNRDLEPMKGGYRDNYYWQFVANMRRYKGMEAPQQVSPAQKIAVDGNFSKWDAVRPEYADTTRDIARRDFVAGVPDIRYIDNSARNDLIAAKVARDARNVAFYVRTQSALTVPSDANWMTLFIDSDNNAATGWNGYDLLINRRREGGKSSIERNVGGAWNWQQMGRAPLRFGGNALELAVPRKLLGSPEGALNLGFKWADNLPDRPDVMDFYSRGDVAPNARFNYLYAAP